MPTNSPLPNPGGHPRASWSAAALAASTVSAQLPQGTYNLLLSSVDAGAPANVTVTITDPVSGNVIDTKYFTQHGVFSFVQPISPNALVSLSVTGGGTLDYACFTEQNGNPRGLVTAARAS